MASTVIDANTDLDKSKHRWQHTGTADSHIIQDLIEAPPSFHMPNIAPISQLRDLWITCDVHRKPYVDIVVGAGTKDDENREIEFGASSIALIPPKHRTPARPGLFLITRNTLTDGRAVAYIHDCDLVYEQFDEFVKPVRKAKPAHPHVHSIDVEENIIVNVKPTIKNRYPVRILGRRKASFKPGYRLD